MSHKIKFLTVTKNGTKANVIAATTTTLTILFTILLADYRVMKSSFFLMRNTEQNAKNYKRKNCLNVEFAPTVTANALKMTGS